MSPLIFAGFALQQAPILTIDQLVASALKGSSRLQAASSRLGEASAARSRAESALRPSLAFNATGTALDRTIRDGFGPVSVVGANQWQSELSLDAGLALDVSGDLRDSIRQARLGERIASLDFARARNELVRDVRQAALSELQAEQLLDVAVSAAINAKDRRATIEKLFEEGVLTRFDVLRSDADVADATQKVIAARNRVRVARAQVVRLAEIPEGAFGALADRDWSKAPISAKPAEAFAARPEIALTRVRVQAERLGVRLASASLRPSLSVGLRTFEFTHPSTFDPQRQVGAAQIQLTIPIFDRGQARAEERAAKSRAEGAEADLRELEEAIRFESTEAESQLQDATERIAVAEKALVAAEEQFRISKERLEAGLTKGSLSPFLELSDSQTALTQARNNLVNARIDRELALNQIAYVRGEEAKETRLP